MVVAVVVVVVVVAVMVRRYVRAARTHT